MQSALESANAERFKWTELVQVYDSELVDARADLQRAQNLESGAAELYRTSSDDYQALHDHSNRQSGEGIRLYAPEVGKLAQKKTDALHNLEACRSKVKYCRDEVARIQKRRDDAQQKLLDATQRWDLISKQIAEGAGLLPN